MSVKKTRKKKIHKKSKDSLPANPSSNLNGYHSNVSKSDFFKFRNMIKSR